MNKECRDANIFLLLSVTNHLLMSSPHRKRRPSLVDQMDTPVKSDVEDSMSQTVRGWLVVLPSVLLVLFEGLVSLITANLPKFVLRQCTAVVRFLFGVAGDKGAKLNGDIKSTDYLGRRELLHGALDIHEMAGVFNFTIEDHIVQTDDNYLLTLHRLNPVSHGIRPNGRVLYFHHGLLMNSEIWLCREDVHENLPLHFLLQGYDCWLGNNRGNKYSGKHLKYKPSQREFWDFSIDEFVRFDIPNNVDYILETTGKETVSYIGFSQGTTQIMAALSVNVALNSKIDKLCVISPATTPRGLNNGLLNSILHFSPNLMYLLFGRNILFAHAGLWAQVMYPKLYLISIDIATNFLFGWKNENMDEADKYVSYYHLYSTTSVKTVVHWFQIMNGARLTMYKDSSSLGANFYTPEYPTRTSLAVPTIIIYGTGDSLVDIDQIRQQLPRKYLKKVVGLEGYEHLDLIWGRRVGDVIKSVGKFLHYNELDGESGKSIIINT